MPGAAQTQLPAPPAARIASCGASQEQDDTFEQGEALLAIDLVVKELVGPDEALEERIDASEAGHEDEVLREQHAAEGDGKGELSEGRAC